MPVVSAGGTLAYVENGSGLAIDNTIAISDPDDAQLTQAIITISSGFTTGDILTFTSQNGITEISNSAGVLIISGTASLANYVTALRSITYHSTSVDPTLTSSSRTITWEVTDANSDGAGAANSFGVTSTITITPLSDLPVITAGDTLVYTENGISQVIDNTITISDIDDTELAGASAKLITAKNELISGKKNFQKIIGSKAPELSLIHI